LQEPNEEDIHSKHSRPVRKPLLKQFLSVFFAKQKSWSVRCAALCALIALSVKNCAKLFTNRASDEPFNKPPIKTGVLVKIKDGFSSKFPDDFSFKEGRENVITIAWPAFAELSLMQLASMVNMMMVGGLGTWAVAAVGFSLQLRLLMIAVFMAFNTGSTALIARAKGADEPEQANKIMHQAILFSMIMSVILSSLGSAFATPLVMFMGASDEATVEAATQYVRVVLLLFPANAFTLAVTAMLRGIGKTRIPMIYNVISNVVNVILGFLLIGGRLGFPALGVRGAAIGLGVGHVVAAIIALAAILKGSDMLKLTPNALFKIDFSMLKRVARIGTPAMFEQFFMRAGNIMFFRIVASLGTDAFATHQIVLNIHQLTFMTGHAFGISATTLLGQSMGRKRPDQGKALVQLCRRYSLIVSLVLVSAIVIFGTPLLALYTDNADVIVAGVALLWIVAAMQPFQSSQQVLAGALRGAGDTKAVAVCIFIGIVVVRPAVAYVLVAAGLGVTGAWLAMFLDQAARAVYVFWRFASDKWKAIKV